MTLGPATFKVTLISLNLSLTHCMADKEVLDMVLTASSRNTGTGSGYQHLIV